MPCISPAVSAVGFYVKYTLIFIDNYRQMIYNENNDCLYKERKIWDTILMTASA